MPGLQVPVFTEEMTQNELNAFRYVPLLQKSFSEGAALEDLLDLTRKGTIASIEQNLASLLSDTGDVNEKLYFSSKIMIRETRVWIDLIIEAYKTGGKDKKDLKTFKQKNQPLLDYLDVLENKLNSHIPHLLIQREKSLKTDFTFQIEKIKEAMKVILLEFVKTDKKIPLLSFSIGKKVFKKISQRLSETQQIILAHRSQFEKKVVEKGCNILIEKLDLYPYPLLYTTKGNIYVIQETMEHFVGVGTFKIVSRTFEMQEGHVRALIRPKKLFEETMTEEKLYDTKEHYFFRSFIESDLLRHVKNKPGIINQFEASGFKQKDDKSFYQICELFDSLELTKLLRKIRTKDPLAPKKESIIAIAKDMILGLLSLKSSGLIHRDLKDDNILVHTSSLHLSAGARFIDFNIACLESQLAAHVMFPVASIAPPEFCKVFLDTNFNYTSNEYTSITGFSQDTWAVGLHLYQIFFKDLPSWMEEMHKKESNKTTPTPEEKDEIVEEILRNQAIQIAKLSEKWIPKEFQNHVMYPLIRSMLEIDHKKRITAEGALILFNELSPNYLKDQSE